MRRARLWTAAVLAFGLLSGCYRTSYQTKLPQGMQRHERWLNYFFWGLAGSHDIDLDEVCPQGVHAWHTDAAAFGLFDIITVGIYSPRSLVIECAGETR